jgi:deoxyribodipyrimidine photo-lyase
LLPAPAPLRTLYWFRNDLRLQDNPGFTAACQSDYLLCVYCICPSPPWCNLTGIGAQRERFRLESLADLDAELLQRGQRLLVLEGNPAGLLARLVNDFRIDRVFATRTPGTHEARQVDQLRAQVSVPLVEHSGNTLFDASQLPFEPSRLPTQFTPFREQVEQLPVATPVGVVNRPPPPPSGVHFNPLPANDTRAHPAAKLDGGAGAGTRRLQGWLVEQGGASSYAETRNDLDGVMSSSRLSAWLADGSLSVRQVAHTLFDYERDVETNRSTRWLYQELLWREFFHWRAYLDGHRLFHPGGRRKRVRLCTFDPRAFARWCQGDTDYPLVNALQRQLLATGWMSNRGRQISASCLVNELNLDWRYGAAFFEKHLIDFDVASNYGNWQYIAGVGCDPRGGRHFNLEKQAAQHDPEGTFTAAWRGYRPKQPTFVTDAADWPISPPD